MENSSSAAGFRFEAGEAAREARFPFTAEHCARGNVVTGARSLRAAEESQSMLCELGGAIERAGAVLEMNGELFAGFESGAELATFGEECV